MRSSTRRALGALIATAVGLGSLAASAPVSSAATDVCSTTAAPVYRTVNPTLTSQLLTRWKAESDTSTTKYGFTDNRGVFGNAFGASAPGLSPVTRLYKASTADFVWAATQTDVDQAVSSGYAVQGVNFYAPTASSSCTVDVHLFVKGTHHRNAWAADEQANLIAAGWTDSGIGFYLRTSAAAAPAPTPAPTATSTPQVAGDDTFSIAVIGDTQTEVTSPSDTRFGDRTAWLAANKDALDLRYVLQTGDISNWGWIDPHQYTMDKAAMAKLSSAGIPYSVTIGNHDTRVVGVGGDAYVNTSACLTNLGADACKSWLLVRKTGEFNAAFPLSNYAGLGGAFESGKSDNYFTTFSANNTKWLVLTLELWPRKEAVAWAKDVVANHPDYNVIIETHHYLNGDSAISGSNGGYGNTSPSYLYDQIVSKYPNVKIVASGHTGGYASRSNTNNGNTVVSYLGNELGSGTNPVRIITVNTTTGSVTSKVYSKVSTSGTTTYATTNNTITITR